MGFKLAYREGRTFFFCAYFVLLQVVGAQQLEFEHYSDHNGLSHNSVRHISQDSEGFLWLGTFSGINRFDGYQFKSYTSANTGSEGIGNDDITALEIDEESHHIWIGTRNGLTLFETDVHRFTTFLPDPDNPLSIPDNEIRSVYVDKFKNVWVGTKDKGLFRYFAENQSFESINIAGFAYVKEIVQDSNGNIWVGSYGTGSIAKIQLDSNGSIAEIKTFTLSVPHSTVTNPYVNFIYQDTKSAIYVGTRAGLYKFDPITDSFVNLHIEDETLRESLGPYFLSIAQAPNGEFWVGTLGGLLVCERLEDIPAGNFQWYHADSSNELSLVDNLVSALYFDTSGVLWIGTEDGLDKYDPFKNQFKLDKRISSHINNQIPRIRGFAKTFDNKVITATRHNGLFISEKDGFAPLYYTDYDIASIYSTDGKTFYCGLWNGKLLVFDYVTQHSKIVDIGFQEAPIFTFTKENERTLIVGSFGEGAKFINTETLTAENTDSVLQGFQIYSIALDHRGNVWYATETGVVRQHLDSGTYREYHHDPKNKMGLPHENIRDVIFDSNGKLWASTRLGLSFYDPDKDEFIGVHTPKELKGKWITDMTMDANGALWLNMNNNSVAKFKTESGKVNVYQVNSGNRLDSFSSSGFFNFDDSPIYIGGKHGVIYFSPYNINENKWSPRPVISEFKVQNKTLIPGMGVNGQKPLQQDINIAKTVSLNYNNRNFSLQFSTPAYANERLNTFSYMLEGFDDDWISAQSDSRTVQYTNLYPGDYKFKVKASNSDGYWSDEVTYDITIKPPFWLSLQGLFLFLAFSALVFFVIRREIKGRLQLKQELLLEKLKRERDEKLNNEKLRFFTNISHELRTPLTLILGPAKQMMQDSEETGNLYQQKKSSLIHQNANRLLTLVNQILDFRKAQTGDLKLKVSKTDILLHTQNTFLSFNELAKEKKINYGLIAENKVLKGWIDRDKYDKILYNLLSNALKFTPRYGTVDLFIGLKDADENCLVVEVSDDGIGIPKESQQKIFSRFYQASNSKANNTGSGIGLSLVKALCKLHKGKISVKSGSGEGSTFTLEIPIDRYSYLEGEVFELEQKTELIESPQVKAAKKIIQSTHLKEKILIAEDNNELRNYLMDYLSDYYKVYEADNGQKALQLCRKIKPVLCVSDVMMPVMDGLNFCHALKHDEATSHIPVILLTALSENEDKIKGYDVGADGYLVKPFDPSLLKIRIENIIKSRLELKTKFSGEIESEATTLTHSPIDKEFMIQLTNLIERDLGKINLTTTFLCRELGMSSSKLYRKTKELTDLAPNEFIRTVRLKKSAQLLKTKKYNVSEVTDLIGFNDPLYFSRCFKKQFGFPPSTLLK